MANRRERKVYSVDLSERYRVFKSHDGKSVVVVRHRRDEFAPAIIVECVGDEFGNVYELEGEVIEENPVSDSVMGSVKKTVAFMVEHMATNFSGRY